MTNVYYSTEDGTYVPGSANTLSFTHDRILHSVIQSSNLDKVLPKIYKVFTMN